MSDSDKHKELVGRCLAKIHGTFGRQLPTFAFVLGSGFQDTIRGFRILAKLPFQKLPGLVQPSVEGHSGILLLAELEGLLCVVVCGRAHYYEGHSMVSVMLPIRILAAAGVKQVVLTNAAGGLNRKFKPGQFMLFSDHINFTGLNPLRGASVADEPRFLDLSCAYSPRLRSEFLESAALSSVALHSGVYIGVSGPTYETPAEIRAFRKLGADAVGMSTIPEVLAARASGMEVAAISCITNHAAGLSPTKLSHQEVLETGRRSADDALRLFTAFARQRAELEKAPLKGKERRKNLKIDSAPLRSETLIRR